MIDIIAINTQQLNNADKPVLVNQDKPKLNSHHLNPLLQDKMHLEEGIHKDLHIHQDLDLHREDKEQLILRSKN